MAWNANDASRQAAHKGLRQQQRQQRFYRSNQQRAARQMRDLMAQYRARVLPAAAGRARGGYGCRYTSV